MADVAIVVVVRAARVGYEDEEARLRTFWVF